MSWLSKLYETYERISDAYSEEESTPIPISHTVQNAHINIILDREGNFLRASVLNKTQIILPATEKSAGRSSGEAPHPLADKLQYVAYDYKAYGGLKPSYFDSYIKQLSDWCSSNFSDPKIKAIYEYVKKGTVISDLIRVGILFTNNENKLLTHWPFEVTEENPIPPIFKLLPKKKVKGKTIQDVGDALVCWSVEVPGNPSLETWKDRTIQKLWIDYNKTLSQNEGFCYILGNTTKNIPIAINHPAKLRHSGDKAKLISSNDTIGFTFRGRFLDASQAAEIGYDVTQKAHNALRWLIQRQGYRNGDQVIVSWAVSGKELPEPFADTFSFLERLEDIPEEEHTATLDYSADIGQTFALKLNKYMAGYSQKLNPTENVIIMGLDSATPGRMAITYYKEMFAQEYIDQITKWHSDFAWYQRHKDENQTIWPIGCPSPIDIFNSAYGKNSSDSLKKNIFQRLIPCILEGRSFPQDIVSLAMKSAINKNSYSKDDYWLWEKNLGIACSLYKGYCIRHPDIKKRREHIMAIDENNNSRDYLYGRLLAIAEYIEEIALRVAQEDRSSTSASRLMQYFADRPFSTWRNIELALQPYKQRLYNKRKGFIINREKDLDNVFSKFIGSTFVDDSPLTGEFLLAYHVQRLELHNKKTDENTDNKQGE